MEQKICHEIVENTLDFIKGEVNINKSQFNSETMCHIVNNMGVNLYICLLGILNHACGVPISMLHKGNELERRIKEFESQLKEPEEM